MASTRTMVFVVTSWALVASVPPLVLLGGAVQFLYTLLVTAVARHEQTRGAPYGFPLIPRMIAGMSLVDGALLAIVVHPAWLIAGIAAATLTRVWQRYVRGE
jgi:4-hydroxybenzoate polyprenyltransferase